MRTPDPYELLGVPRDAGAAEVWRAYARLWVIFDPQRWEPWPDLAREAAEWADALDAARHTLLGSDADRVVALSGRVRGEERRAPRVVQSRRLPA